MTSATTPTAASSDDSDLTSRIVNLSKKIGLQGEDGEKASPIKTPDSVQVVKAGALQFSKLWALVVASGTTVGGVVSIVRGTIAQATQGFTAAGQATFIGGGFFLLSSGAIAVAWIVSSDVRCRAAATVAQINGRVAIAESLLSATSAKLGPTGHPTKPDDDGTQLLLVALSAYPDALKASTSGTPKHKVVGIGNGGDEGPSIKLESGDWVPISKVTRFETEER